MADTQWLFSHCKGARGRRQTEEQLQLRTGWQHIVSTAQSRDTFKKGKEKVDMTRLRFLPPRDNPSSILGTQMEGERQVVL